MENKKTNQQVLEEQLLNNGFKKTIYVFTAEEIRKLQSLDTIVQMANMAQEMISNIVQNQCLPRLSIKNSVDTRVLYDIPAGQFSVYSPKVWCKSCNSRKADFEYQGQFYCQSCVDKLKASEPKKELTNTKKVKGARK